MDKDCDTMLKNGIIDFGDSEWATALVFAKKKDGGLRAACDFRGLNEQLVADRYVRNARHG